ncbi:MAG: hypothetical protein JXB24_11855 [Bacteroidales bacterium]|jgi:hypothetical protein|nr:hypothetical protein [Bacteroidales bacterium]
MIFPDPNIGYIFGYKSKITSKGILITFLWEGIKILFRFENIRHIKRVTYSGGKISWDILRWGKCPPGKNALYIKLKKGIFKNHLIVFNDLESAVTEINKPKFELHRN